MAMPGGSGPISVRRAEFLFAVPIVCLAASPAAAADKAFHIHAARLSEALISLAEQAGITIAVTDPAVAMLGARSLHGRMSVRAALDRVLAGSGYRYEFVGPQAVRIVRAARRPPPRPRPAPPEPAAPLPAATAPDIIVTASKQGVSLDRFGGTARVIDLHNQDVGRFGVRGSDAILDRLPMLSSTSLGPGRNKLYIRGVADSSFNGPSQSIVGQYLGDVRLTFNAPDPDLHLYDIQQVEVLEGPQGTLYGTGALGGILRLVPTPPNLRETAGSMSAGLLSTHHGGWGGDVAGMINLPLATDRLALRIVGYGSDDGGYIDDAVRGRRGINRTHVYGGRATLLLDAGNGWRIELGALGQYLAGRDGQYAMRGLPPLTRATNLPQPFDNDYRLGEITIRKNWSGVELVSATGIVRHDLETQFDATGFPRTSGPQLYVEDVRITLITNETRLSQPNAHGEGWVVGWSVVHDVDEINRSLGPPESPLPIAGVRNSVSEGALFGQYSLRLGGNVVGTLGGRATLSRNVGEPLNLRGIAAEPGRTDFRVSPMASITWRPHDGLLFYARVQQGFRAGGLAVEGVGRRAVATRFESDGLTSFEAGFRLGRSSSPFHLDTVLSAARWSHVQADLIDRRGLPFTTNLGDGRILGLETNASWRVSPAFSLEAAAFLNDSALSHPDSAYAAAQDRDLPNVPRAGARAAAHLTKSLSHSLTLAVDGALRYVGRSHLGIGAPLDQVQSGFVDGQLGSRLDFGRFGVSVDVDNVADARGNRFSFGNPFTVANGLQTTPLRPRTVRLGFDATF